jgi:RimJ/RimL family protein N-acetyltransferase
MTLIIIIQWDVSFIYEWWHHNDNDDIIVIELGADKCLLGSCSYFNSQSSASLREDEAGQEDSRI